MKFSCDRCQTRYSIGDDKVKGKVLKIRCKTCGNIVVVREQLPTVQGEASGYATPQMHSTGTGTGSVSLPASSTSGGRPAPAPAPGPAPGTGKPIEWYVAIKGKQHGPASHDEVVRLFKDGRITDRSYVWHDQLPAWMRLKEVADFAAAVAEGPAPRRPPPPPEEGAEIVNFEAARAQRAQPQPAPGPVIHDPFAALPSSQGGPEAPRESTRVFIMQAGLHNRESKHKLYAGIGVAVTIGLIAIGVIDYQLDILGLKRVVDAVAVSTGIKDAVPDPVEGGWDDAEEDPALKCQFAPDRGECIKQAEARIAAKGGRKRPPKTPGAGTGASVSADDLKGAFGTPGAGTPGETPTTKTTIDGSGFMGVGGGGLAMDTTGLGKRTGPKAPTVQIDLPSTAGTTIDAANAAKVVRDGQGAIQVCVDNAMKNNEDIPQKIRLTVSIGLKGTVERSVINNAVIQASPLGGCLSSAAKKWKFAPPTEAADLEIPLVLR
jgi:predicted Zn finger-like uncharacterized protein